MSTKYLFLLSTLFTITFVIKNSQCMDLDITIDIDRRSEKIHSNSLIKNIEDRNYKRIDPTFDVSDDLIIMEKYNNIKVKRDISKIDITYIIDQVVQNNCSLTQALSGFTNSSQSEPLQEDEKKTFFSQKPRDYYTDNVMNEYELIDFLFTLHEEAACQARKEILKECSIVSGFGLSLIFSCGLSWCVWTYCVPQEDKIDKYIPSLSKNDLRLSVFDIRRERLKIFSSNVMSIAKDMMNELHKKTGVYHHRMKIMDG